MMDPNQQMQPGYDPNMMPQPMGGQMMAPAPMQTNIMTNNTMIQNTTIIQQERDPYMDANGQPEDVIDREFRIMAGSQENQPNMWCISCKTHQTSMFSKETTT